MSGGIQLSKKGPIVNSVSVGGADICVSLNGQHAGCSANFSLVAIKYADGSVVGQITDQVGQGQGGYTADVVCLTVVGNEAWLNGEITSWRFEGEDFTGFPFIMKVRDGGPPSQDEVSPTIIGYDWCTNRPAITTYHLTGQVTVR